MGVMMPASYQKFTSQMDLGRYLTSAVPHTPTERAYELRDMPPMKTTRETGIVTASERAGGDRIAPAKLTLAEVRAKLEGKSGKRFWKNLDELAETPGFHEMLAEEFPRQAGGAATSGWMR